MERIQPNLAPVSINPLRNYAFLEWVTSVYVANKRFLPCWGRDEVGGKNNITIPMFSISTSLYIPFFYFRSLFFLVFNQIVIFRTEALNSKEIQKFDFRLVF